MSLESILHAQEEQLAAEQPIIGVVAVHCSPGYFHDRIKEILNTKYSGDQWEALSLQDSWNEFVYAAREVKDFITSTNNVEFLSIVDTCNCEYCQEWSPIIKQALEA